jgi:anionic cell wall polymer biosynthesis LytR-Cps2A-Psr (LCP) family protein
MAPIRNFLIYVLAVAVLGTSAIAIYDTTAPQSKDAAPSQGSVLRPLPPPFAGVERLRLLLIGADERKGDVGRSDTLMVLQVNPTLRRATLLSLPRDLRVEIPGHGHDKINAAFARGGPELSKQTVEQYLGLTLDGWVKINIEGFVKAVDTLGGVDINVEDVEVRAGG